MNAYVHVKHECPWCLRIFKQEEGVLIRLWDNPTKFMICNTCHENSMGHPPEGYGEEHATSE